MSFFDLESPADGSMEMGGSMEPIPEGTQVLAYIEDAKVEDPSEYSKVKKVKLTWTVLQPEEYKNRKVFHNIKAYDEKPEVAKKHRAMLAAIDANAGGKLLASGKEPDDLLLMSCLSQKQMILKLAVWDMNDNKGNWVMSVAPKGAATAQAAPVAKSAPAVAGQEDFDDDIPF